MRRILIGYLLNSVYLLAIVFALPWLVWSMIFRGKYREGYAQKLFGYVPRRGGSRPCVWLHAVSVGEVNVLRTLVTRLEDEWPDAELVISSTTKAGYDLARQRFARHTVIYCPLDFTWAVARAIARIRPDLLILAELELWPNLILAAKRHGAAVAIVNGRLSDKSFRGYRRLGWLVAEVLRHVDLVAAQDAATASRFAELTNALTNGVGTLFSRRSNGSGKGKRSPRREQRIPTPSPAIHVTGSLKYDGAETDRRNPATERLRSLAGIRPDDVVLVAGSTQVEEEELVLDTYRKLVAEFPSLRLIIVPRHPQRFREVAERLDQSGLPWMRRSEVTGSGPFFRGEESDALCPTRFTDAKKEFRPLFLVDTIGELGAWWGTADIALVGGSFGDRGGQNMIEPAAYGAAVCFGPNTRNFRDIVQALLQANAACVVADGQELTAFVRECLMDRSWAADLGQRARELVLSQLGATQRTVTLLRPLLPRPAPEKDASLPAA